MIAKRMLTQQKQRLQNLQGKQLKMLSGTHHLEITFRLRIVSCRGSGGSCIGVFSWRRDRRRPFLGRWWLVVGRIQVALMPRICPARRL